jgi:hypothetical protein
VGACGLILDLLLPLFDREQPARNFQRPVVAAPRTQDCFGRRRWKCSWASSVMYYYRAAATGAVFNSLEHTHRNSFLTVARRTSEGSDLEIPSAGINRSARRQFPC